MKQKKKVKDNRGGAGRNQGRKKRAETSTFTIRTRIEWRPIVKQAAKDKENELKALERKAL